MSVERPDLSLEDDLALVLSRMVVGWEDRLGVDLAEHPEVQRVMERYRNRTILASPQSTLTREELLADLLSEPTAERTRDCGNEPWPCYRATCVVPECVAKSDAARQEFLDKTLARRRAWVKELRGLGLCIYGSRDSQDGRRR